MGKRPVSDTWYEHYLSEETLMGSTCQRCGAVYVPPRPLCVECRNTEMRWTRMNGTGKLAAFTSISIGPPAMRAEGYDRGNPYCTGVVKLDEGPRIVARIEGVDARNPDSINVGAFMQAVYLHRGSGEGRTTQLAFRPIRDNAR